MAATVTLNEYNGTSGAEARTDKTSGTVRFKKADNATVDNANPLIPPVTGGQFDRSFHKYIRARIGATAPSGDIRNVVAYLSGTQSTGVTVYGRSVAGYSTPAQADGTGEGSTYVDASTWTSGSPKSLGAGPYSSANADFGDYLDLYMKTADAATAKAWNGSSEVAPPGGTRPVTLTIAWDET